jgi:hypothetical protein
VKTRIHVNQHVIRRNNKVVDADSALMEPPITVKRGRTNTYCKSVEMLGPSTVVYSPDKPLSCGAKVWIETDDEVRVTG